MHLNEIILIFYLVGPILENRKSDIKILLFAQNLDKKSTIRKIFEKSNETGIIACYKDNERTLSDYIRKKLEGYNGLSQHMINFLISKQSNFRSTTIYKIFWNFIYKS